MNRDIAEKWIADLRSNPPQARGRLFDGNGHCCLGRLCILAGIEPKYSIFSKNHEFNHEVFNLPTQVIEWAGMKTNDGIYNRRDNGDADNLGRDNDHGKTFAEIADIIAAHIDEL